MESGSNESLNQEPLEVTPGNDPLSQLASESPPKSAVISLLDPVEGSVEQQKGGRSSTLVGLCLSLEDHNRLRAFVQEFVGQRLLPHLEAVLKNLNEWVRKRRKKRGRRRGGGGGRGRGDEEGRERGEVEESGVEEEESGVEEDGRRGEKGRDGEEEEGRKGGEVKGEERRMKRGREEERKGMR